jgi:hypothetical protein
MQGAELVAGAVAEVGKVQPPERALPDILAGGDPTLPSNRCGSSGAAKPAPGGLIIAVPQTVQQVTNLPESQRLAE